MNLMPSFYDNAFRPLHLGIEVPMGQRARVCVGAAAAPRGFLPFFFVVFTCNLKTHVPLESESICLQRLWRIKY